MSSHSARCVSVALRGANAFAIRARAEMLFDAGRVTWNIYLKQRVESREEGVFFGVEGREDRGGSGKVFLS